MYVSFASPWVDPWDTWGELSGTQGGWYSFGISFFSAGKGSCLVLKTSLPDHGDIPRGFDGVLVSEYRSRPKFFAPFYFILIYDPV